MVTRESFGHKKTFMPRRLCPAIPFLQEGTVIALPGHGCMEGECSGWSRKEEGIQAFPMRVLGGVGDKSL